MTLSELTSRLLRMKRPLVAGVVGPPELDAVTKGGIITYLQVAPASPGLAQTYFPLGYETKGGIAYAKIFLSEKDSKALNELRKRVRGKGSVIIVSEAKKLKDYYIFKNGIMLAIKCSHLGLMSWHALVGSYPPLELKEEPLYPSPTLLATVESVFSGYGLYIPSFVEVPVVVKEEREEHKLPLPLSLLLALPAWRAKRLASGKEAESGGKGAD